MPGSLGGGGNEACDARKARVLFELMSDLKPPDSLPPAERLRAVLPVGTNRASHVRTTFAVRGHLLVDGHADPRAKRMPVEDFAWTLEFGRKTGILLEMD